MRVTVQEPPFDAATELRGFGGDGMGAIVTFTGIVRDNAQGDLVAMDIEHYPAMTRRAIEKIEAEAVQRWSLLDSLIIHRHGVLRPADMIMMVATAARHRKDAFEAAEFLMDFLKSRAPFWKKELTADGGDWVAAKSEDEDALTRW